MVSVSRIKEKKNQQSNQELVPISTRYHIALTIIHNTENKKIHQNHLQLILTEPASKQNNGNLINRLKVREVQFTRRTRTCIKPCSMSNCSSSTEPIVFFSSLREPLMITRSIHFKKSCCNHYYMTAGINIYKTLTVEKATGVKENLSKASFFLLYFSSFFLFLC